MKKIIVASRNPVKINSALDGFQRMFPNEVFDVEGISVPSGVSDQPMTDAETLQGAQNRAQQAKTKFAKADYWVGIEGGLDESSGDMEAFAWVVILSTEQHGKSCTSTFYLPEKTQELIRQGYELGHADDKLFGLDNSKEKGGSVGNLTGEVLSRTEYYEQAVMLALIPFKNPALYKTGK